MEQTSLLPWSACSDRAVVILEQLHTMQCDLAAFRQKHPKWSRVASVTRVISRGITRIVRDTSGLCGSRDRFMYYYRKFCWNGSMPRWQVSPHIVLSTRFEIYSVSIMKKTQLHHFLKMNIKNRQVFERNKTPSWRKFPQKKKILPSNWPGRLVLLDLCNSGLDYIHGLDVVHGPKMIHGLPWALWKLPGK